jgi:SNF2 family DNA or RNA helicase
VAGPLPRLEIPEELQFERVTCDPAPVLKVRRAKHPYATEPPVAADLWLEYNDWLVKYEQPEESCFQSERRRLLVRNRRAETQAYEWLRAHGFRPASYYLRDQGSFELPASKLAKSVRLLTAAGWRVEAEGKLYRSAGEIRVEVASGIDWFELHGTVAFGDVSAKLPALLAALKRGEDSVVLDDGSIGMLPQEWLKKYGVLAGLGSAHDDHLRFTRAQVGLLDALLASQPEARCDEVFNRARQELQSFDGIAPVDPPAGFTGQLRGYQRDGLGWLHFLQRFGFGGCLADDMGLGKTVQVLGLLECRRTDSEHHGPSLVVVPNSLVFNWKQEAARFTPQLRVLDHTGIERIKGSDHFDEFDVILTTYGTLRRDALIFKDVEFDFCILDEAQMIKNASTESAKAARLLCARHRLAMSGTPIENHLGELWSLFEFLNPGMLGTASVFQLGGAGARNPDLATRELLAKALRPFILRRTKDQVAKDLPAKLEQTLYCELEPEQRKLYNELRDHYRMTLLGKVDRDGINKSKIQILEALLRLRQAACHPGLLDKTRIDDPSAKLDMLIPQLEEVIDEGHKVLVFSQFTSFLAILKKRLDAEGTPYEYLDGKTRNRGDKVEHFQTDPNCKLFLISLKAGGLGLNLTAAEYVFLLDPWWNPAVEAQAIDRTHRIGQTRQVFAYRLIARDTVEEKVLELQNTKRNLADAIINADNSLIRDLGREDLELLLS